MSIIMRRTATASLSRAYSVRANEDNIEQNKNQFHLWSIKLETPI